MAKSEQMKQPKDEQTRAMEARGFITAQEAIRRLCVTHTLVYRYLSSGRLKGARVGGRRYISWESFAAFAGPLAGEPPSGAIEAHDEEPEI